jgi:hypothetical protein
VGRRRLGGRGRRGVVKQCPKRRKERKKVKVRKSKTYRGQNLFLVFSAFETHLAVR